MSWLVIRGPIDVGYTSGGGDIQMHRHPRFGRLASDFPKSLDQAEIKLF